MLLTDERELTLGKIACEWSREVANAPGGRNRDDTLRELLRAVWRGDFEDEDGHNSCLSIHQPPAGRGQRVDGKIVDEHGVRIAETDPVTYSRRSLLRALASDPPQGLPLPPGRRGRDWYSPESDGPEPVPWSELKLKIPWDILDALTLDEYSELFLTAYLEPLAIAKDDFGRWCDGHEHTRPVFWFGDKARLYVAEKTLGAAHSGLTQAARSRGGSRLKRKIELLEAMGRVVEMLIEDGTPPTFPAVWGWLEENAQEHNRYVFAPLIPGCDYLYVDGDTLCFQDQVGKPYTARRRTLERYISEAKKALKRNL